MEDLRRVWEGGTNILTKSSFLYIPKKVPFVGMAHHNNWWFRMSQYELENIEVYVRSLSISLPDIMIKKLVLILNFNKLFRSSYSKWFGTYFS